jgi:nucleotide-binding universal stress UspA family protein
MIRPTRMTAPATVLMPFDGSPQAAWALPIARTIVQVMGGTLHLVMSGERDEIRERLSLQKPTAMFHELLGDLTAGVLRLATFNPDAFIVLPAPSGTLPESGFGLFPEELLRLADCPVLLVQPRIDGSTWRPSRILVPQDGTAAAARSLCPVVRLAERAGAEVLVLHVSCERSPSAPEPGTMEFPAYVDQPQHELPSWVSGFLERVRHGCGLSPRMSVRFHWARGDPAREIVQLARQKRADLITVSWSRTRDPRRAQVVREVLREAPCPILVLPAVPC